jgi:SET domain-containing protein
MEKVEVRKTKDGKGSSLFVVEEIEKYEYVMEYLGKIEYNRTENNYVMKIDRMNLWINGNKYSGLAQYINHSCNPKCKLVQLGVDGLPHMCFFAKRKINSGMELTFDFNWELVGPRGAPTTCHNQHGTSWSYSFGQICADRKQIFVLITM